MLPFPMASITNLVCSAASASYTLVPSQTAFGQSFPAHRVQSRRLAAPLFSYSYELLFPQPLWIHIHTNCPGVWGYSYSSAFTGLRSRALSRVLSKACSLFARSKKVNSFAINQIQPLFLKHPWSGYVYLQTARPATWTRRTHPIIIAAMFARRRTRGNGSG